MRTLSESPPTRPQTAPASGVCPGQARASRWRPALPPAAGLASTTSSLLPPAAGNAAQVGQMGDSPAGTVRTRQGRSPGTDMRTAGAADVATRRAAPQSGPHAGSQLLVQVQLTTLEALAASHCAAIHDMLPTHAHRCFRRASMPPELQQTAPPSSARSMRSFCTCCIASQHSTVIKLGCLVLLLPHRCPSNAPGMRPGARWNEPAARALHPAPAGLAGLAGCVKGLRKTAEARMAVQEQLHAGGVAARPCAGATTA